MLQPPITTQEIEQLTASTRRVARDLGEMLDLIAKVGERMSSGAAIEPNALEALVEFGRSFQFLQSEHSRQVKHAKFILSECSKLRQ